MIEISSEISFGIMLNSSNSRKLLNKPLKSNKKGQMLVSILLRCRKLFHPNEKCALRTNIFLKYFFAVY